MLTVVIGPPAAGKSTWCRQQAGPDDVIIDHDLIALALSPPRDGESKHEHSKAVKAVTKAARQAAIDKALTLSRDVDVYLIHSTPSRQLLDTYRARGARIQVIDPGMDVVLERAKRERPWWMQGAIRNWYAQQDPTRGVTKGKRPASRHERGLGTRHDHQRTRLMSAHVDGTPCWWCGEPMYRDRTRNPDYDPDGGPASGSLAADHTHARTHGGEVADRLLHGLCNKRRGDGSRDHLRPTAPPPAEPSDAPRALTTRAWL